MITCSSLEQVSPLAADQRCLLRTKAQHPLDRAIAP